MVNFAMEFKYPRPPKSLSEALGIAMCIAPAREFRVIARNLILDHLHSVVEQNLKEAKTKSARDAILKLFNDLKKESENEPLP